MYIPFYTYIRLEISFEYTRSKLKTFDKVRKIASKEKKEPTGTVMNCIE